MNDCLMLPFSQGPRSALAGWEAAWLPLGEGEAVMVGAVVLYVNVDVWDVNTLPATSVNCSRR